MSENVKYKNNNYGMDTHQVWCFNNSPRCAREKLFIINIIIAIIIIIIFLLISSDCFKKVYKSKWTYEVVALPLQQLPAFWQHDVNFHWCLLISMHHRHRQLVQRLLIPLVIHHVQPQHHNHDHRNLHQRTSWTIAKIQNYLESVL